MEYTIESIHNIVNAQREYFLTGATLPIKFRLEMLKKLKQAMIDNEQMLAEAMNKDLGRDYFEAYLCDIGTVILEVNEILHGLKKWARPERHSSGMLCFPSSKTIVYKKPYGVSLIMSPFNFPYLLTFGVLAASIAGGNTAVIKTSSKSKYCTDAMIKLISSIYPENYVKVIDGGHDVADMCLNERFDKIFYTGSPNVGKHVMECASKNLTPVALELGGETGNWCIVRKDANLKDAARKIAFFKSLNSGQICINVNQIAIASEVKDEFIKELKQAFINALGENPLTNKEYPHLIASSAFRYCKEEASKYQDRIVFGGNGDETTLKFEPTIIYPVDINEDIVNHELFNPLLPVVVYDDDKVDELINTIERREHGLSLYIFTKDLAWANKCMASMQFGGGCINEVCVQLMVKGVPFNGTGHSGMGAYHGEWGFREFTHPCTVLKGKTHFNLNLREHPYSKKKLKMIKFFEK